LKWRVRIEHVRIRPSRREQHLQHGVRTIALRKPSPHVDAPAEPPARRIIASQLQGSSGGSGQLRRIFQRDLVGWMQCIEMRDVAMAQVRRIEIPVFQPLLRSEEHTSELQSRENLVCRLLLEKKKKKKEKETQQYKS